MADLMTAKQTSAAAVRAGLRRSDLELAGIAVMTFNRSILERLSDRCEMHDAPWLGADVHPYAAPSVVRKGECDGLGVTVLVPTMGASPVAATIEDLIEAGASAVFLACAAWSLGPPVRFGDLLIPSFTVGQDGTSIHYGNAAARVEAPSAVVAALLDAALQRGVPARVGGNATCEAVYRITDGMVEDYRRRGCVSMENGEGAVLFAVCRCFGIPSGAVFQPYIDLTEGWNPDRLDDVYQATCRLQADVILDAALRLRAENVIER